MKEEGGGVVTADVGLKKQAEEEGGW